MPEDQQPVLLLAEELKCFDGQKPDLLKRFEGQFALIKGNQLIGTYASELDAYVQAIKQLGNVPFLIKLIVAKEEPVWIPIVSTDSN